MTVFNASNSGWKTKQYPLFMGEDMSLYDSVNLNYKKIFDIYKQQVSQRWTENEFNHEQSRLDLLSCPRNIYDVMLLNLSFQWVLDSVASRAIAPLFAPFVTNSELWAALMENSNMECHVEGTEVLTSQGWKNFSLVTAEDLIAQWDTVTKEVSFVKPSSIVVKSYNGKVFKFSNPQKHVCQVVTPNHRMVQWSAKKKVHSFVEAEQSSYSSSTDFPVAGYLKGETEITPLERFYIAAQADGTVSDRYTGEICGTIPVWFGFSKLRKIKRLFDICKLANLEIIELTTETPTNPNKKPCRRFKVNLPLKDFVNVKRFDWVDFSKISCQWCEGFLKEVVEWDGSKQKSGCVYYSTTVPENAKVVQAIAHLGGYKTHYGIRTDDRKESFNDSHIVSWVKGDKRSGQNINKDVEEYNGKVYCLTVPTGAFLVRYNDCVSVSGNCIHALSYSEIVRQCVSNPEDVFKLSVENEKTIQRAVKVVSVFDALQKAGAEYTLGIIGKNQETYNTVFKGMVALYILERLQFMASFAATFAVCEQGYFQSIGKKVQKIMLDEIFCHYALDAEVLNIEMQTERGKIAMQQCKQDIIEMIEEVVSQEESWSNYLFDEGRSIVGLNETLLNEWVHYNAQAVYDGLGLTGEIKFKRIVDNPLKWMDNWIDIDKFQNAMQELDGNNYALNVVTDDLAEDQLDF